MNTTDNAHPISQTQCVKVCEKSDHEKFIIIKKIFIINDEDFVTTEEFDLNLSNDPKIGNECLVYQDKRRKH